LCFVLFCFPSCFFYAFLLMRLSTCSLLWWTFLHTWRWPCRPKHVVKDSESHHTIKLHAGGNITCKTHWTIQCSRMIKYSNIKIRLKIIRDDSWESMKIYLRRIWLDAVYGYVYVRHPISAKVDTNFTDKRRSLGRHSTFHLDKV
jgi:hypothetical protein